MTKENEIKTITNKKELLNNIGNWPTVMTTVSYELGKHEITLKYNGQIVLFKSDNQKFPAFIAAQFHEITNKQYQDFSMKGVK